MKKTLLFICAALMAALGAAAQATVKIKTALPAGEKLTLTAYCATIDEAITVDWGDGNPVSYNIDPDGYGWSQRTEGEVKGDGTITVTGPLTYFRCEEQQLTSFEATGADKLKELSLGDNQIAQANLGAMPALETLDLSGNKLTAFALPDMPKLKNLDLADNQIDNADPSQLDIQSAAGSLEELDVKNNRIVTLNLNQFSKLEYFYASGNPTLTTAVFYDGSKALRSIDMSNCDVVHFYAISLPELRTLQLSDNSLWDLEDGDYPKLATLGLANNDISELNLTKYTALENLYVNGNKLAQLNVSNNPALRALNCAHNSLSSLDVSANKDIKVLVCDSNKLSRLDIDGLKLQTLSISGNHIGYLNFFSQDLYNLEEFRAADTDLSYAYFNYVNTFGPFKKIDVRNNKNMTPQGLNVMFYSMPQRSSESYSPNVLIDGSNYETADTEYPNSQDMNWMTDKQGDGSAKATPVKITVDATDTGEKVEFTGTFGGMNSDQTFTFTKYAADHGTFTLAQLSGKYFQQLADVTTEANLGVPMRLEATPDKGYKLKEILVNGQPAPGPWFTVTADATIKAVFEPEDRVVAFEVAEGQELSIAFGADKPNTKIQIDWGNGSKQEYTITSTTGVNRFDGVANGTTVKVYGDVTTVNLEGWGEAAEEMGLWDNHITGVDLSGNTAIRNLSLYMNPIKTLDVSMLADLETLDASYCELKSLDLSNNPKLTSLKCYADSIEQLDLSNNPLLVSLDAKNCALSSIDLSAQTSLVELNLNNNHLTAIDLSKMPQLQSLDIMGNKLSQLDVAPNIHLTELNVSRNLLSELDLSQNTELVTLSFSSNSLRNLDLRSNTALQAIDCGDNGMDACEMDDFYWNLPQYPDLPDDEKPTGVTLRVSTGEEETPNEAQLADGSIAVARGWKTNISGNASGCDMAYVELLPSENGTYRLVDADGNVYQTGDKAPKGKDLKIEATPDEGYELGKVMAGTVEVDANGFRINKYTKLSVEFNIATGIGSASAASVSAAGVKGAVVVNAPAGTKISLVAASGATVATATAAGAATSMPAQKGMYVVKAAGKTFKVVVK